MVSRLTHLSLRIKSVLDVNKNHLTKDMISLAQLRQQFKMVSKNIRSSGKIISIAPQDCFNEGVCPLAKSFHATGDENYLLMHVFIPVKYYGERNHYDGKSTATGYLADNYGVMEKKMNKEDHNQVVWNRYEINMP